MGESSSHWAFAGGVVLGSALVAGTAYAAYRFGVSTAAEESRRVRRRMGR